MSRLGELLARNLGISKTAAARLIDEGRVCDAAGVPYTDRKASIQVGMAAAPAGTEATTPNVPMVFVDGDAVSLWSAALVMLHKPVGVVTALRDNVHPTAYDLLREAPLFPELRAAGRLDLETSGLLLWTTEGALIQRLTHPKRRVPRTYQAALAGPFTPPPPELVLDDGHRPELLELRPLSPTEIHPGLIVPAGGAVLATVTIVGGAYHEVRRLFAALGTHVLGLCRTRFGAYELPVDLPSAGWRALPLPAGFDGSP
ncbi:MAG: pseudouridine synthase [Polyangia bacterium]